MSLVMVNKVWKSFGAHDVLCGVSLSVAPGERVAPLGRNGCGKSTLLRVVAGRISPDSGTVQMAKRARLGYLSQDLEELGAGDAFSETAAALADLLAMEKALEELTQQMAARPHDEKVLQRYERVSTEFEMRSGYSWQQRVRSVLLGLGLAPDALHRSVDDLSGGERMRVGLARTLLLEPDILILDEPTNHLDLGATEWLEGFLRSFAGACLLVSHDRYFLDTVAQRVVEIEDGVDYQYSGNFTAYTVAKARRREQAEGRAQKAYYAAQHELRAAATLKSQRKHGAAATRNRRAQALLATSTVRQRAETGMHVHVTQPEWVSTLVAQAQGLVKTYGERRILNDVTFTISGGEHVAVIGPNGGGKTTLLRLLMAQEEPTAGSVRLGTWVRWAHLGQETTFSDPNRNVLDELLAHKKGLSPGDARNLLARFLFTGDAVFQPLSSLSGGEKTRLALLCLLQEEPHCLLLDEPTNHLDIHSRECLEEALALFKGTIVAVSHDRFFLNRVASRILELRDGRLRSFKGNYQAYLRALTLGEASQARTKRSEVRSVMVTGKQQAHQGSRSAALRQSRRQRPLDLEKRIGAVETRLAELEAKFQEPTFYRDRSAHGQLQEHQRLLEELAVLYEARGE